MSWAVTSQGYVMRCGSGQTTLQTLFPISCYQKHFPKWKKCRIMAQANNTYFNRKANEQTKHFFLWRKLFTQAIDCSFDEFSGGKKPRRDVRTTWQKAFKLRANACSIVYIRQLYVVARGLKMVWNAVIKVCRLFTFLMTANDVSKS